MKKTLTAVVTGGLLAGGAAIPAAARAAERPRATIAWRACTDAELVKAGAQCGTLQVPLDHARPDGRQITLALSRVRHTVPAHRYQGVMLVNPGGPGGSGLGLATLGAGVPKGAGKAYDWIGFDPRGVGASRPALACDDKVTAYDRPYYVPETRALERTWLARARDYARKCAAAGGALLDHVKTADNVRDMDNIRRALGVRQINFYGFSYGSYLGQVYSTRYPGAVRRMVLDGVVDPRKVWYRSNLLQNKGYDRNAGIFFDWVAKHDDAYALGTSGRAVARKYYAELAKVRRQPAGGVIGPAELNDAMLNVTYSVQAWPDTAAAFAALVNKRDVKPIKETYDAVYPQGPGSDNSYAMYLATQCTDARWPRDWSRWRRDNWRSHAEAPFETWGNAWFNAPCRYWRAEPGTPPRVDGRQAPPILLIGETLDAATPFAGALEVRRRYPRAVLVEGAGGTTHASSLNGVACVDDTVAQYLATGALPVRRSGSRADRLCEPLPQPQPTAAGAAQPAGELSRMR